MSSWIPLATADLFSFADAAERPTLQDPALATVVSDLLSDVVARVRAELVSGGATALPTDAHTIPAALREATCVLTLRALRHREAHYEETVTQQDEIARAEAMLRRVAQGELTFEPPAEAQATPPRGDVALLSWRKNPLDPTALRAF